jgi:hypothetical protein
MRDLLGGRCSGTRSRFVGTSAGILFFEPKAVVLPGPIDIDGAAAHRLESSLHADGADVVCTENLNSDVVTIKSAKDRI